MSERELIFYGIGLAMGMASSVLVMFAGRARKARTDGVSLTLDGGKSWRPTFRPGYNPPPSGPRPRAPKAPPPKRPDVEYFSEGIWPSTRKTK